MKRRGLTTTDCIAAVLFVALEIATIQGLGDWKPREWWFAFMHVPFGTLVLAALVKVGLDLWRDGKARPFMFGFATFGLGTLAAARYILFDLDGMDGFFRFAVYSIFEPLIRILPRRLVLNSSDILGETLAFFVLLMPELLLSLLGGFLARRCGITLIAMSRRRDVDSRASLPAAAPGVVGSSPVEH